MVDVGSEGLNDILLDDSDLRAGVEDGRDLGAAVDEDVDFLQGEAEGGSKGDGRRMVLEDVEGVFTHSRASRGGVLGEYYLILVSLYLSHLEFFGDVFANGGASSENVGRRGK